MSAEGTCPGSEGLYKPCEGSITPENVILLRKKQLESYCEKERTGRSFFWDLF